MRSNRAYRAQMEQLLRAEYRIAQIGDRFELQSKRGTRLWYTSHTYKRREVAEQELERMIQQKVEEAS